MEAHYARVYRRGVVLTVAAALAVACAVDATVLVRRLTEPVPAASDFLSPHVPVHSSLPNLASSILPILASVFAGILCSIASWWELWIWPGGRQEAKIMSQNCTLYVCLSHSTLDFS